MAVTPAPDHVVIVGAGFVGLSTAWYLQEAGVKVTVVDRGGVASGSSWGNAGWLTPALTLPIAEPSIFSNGLKMMFDPASPLYIPLKADGKLLRFLLGFTWHSTPKKWEEAMRIYSEIGTHGLDAFDEISEGTSAGPGVAEKTKPADPFLTGFTSFKDRDALLHEFEMIQKTGGSVDYELLSGDELRAIEPTLSNNVAAGVAIKNQRYINPPKFMESLAESVVARGGDIIGSFNVTDVRDNGGSVTVIGSEGRAITADHVVMATGAWMTDLAKKFGVNVVVQAGRGYSFTVEPESMPTHPIYFPSQRVACTPLGDRFHCRNYGIPRREPQTGAKTHRSNCRCCSTGYTKESIGGKPQGRVGWRTAMHRRWHATGRPDWLCARLSRWRPWHVGRCPRTIDRQDSRRADYRADRFHLGTPLQSIA